MKTTSLIGNMLKTAIVFFSFSVFCNHISAQNNIQSMSTDEVKAKITNNLNAGLSRYNGLNVQYAISVDQLEGAKTDPLKFITLINHIPGVLSCSLDINKLLVYVNCPKDDTSDYLAAIKSNLAEHNIKIFSFKEYYYKK